MFWTIMVDSMLESSYGYLDFYRDLSVFEEIKFYYNFDIQDHLLP